MTLPAQEAPAPSEPNHSSDEDEITSRKPVHTANVISLSVATTVSPIESTEQQRGKEDRLLDSALTLEKGASHVLTSRPETYWSEFGFDSVELLDDGVAGKVPQDVVIFTTATPADGPALTSFVKPLGGPPFFLFAGERRLFLFRVAPAFDLPVLPNGVLCLKKGETVPLPAGAEFQPRNHRCHSATDLPLLVIAAADASTGAKLAQPVKTPLTAFSLLGKAAQFEENVVAASPVLGNVCLAGQSTVWYAAPNAGKTLIALKLLTEAVEDGRVVPGNAYYINADDGNEGFATKLRILDDIGVHTLAPGHNGFQASDLAGLLRKMAESNTARGTLIIVDTLKKFADLMHKKEASTFGEAARQYVMKGGTLLGLAHTNKNPGSNGKPSYAGVADVVQDADAAYMMTGLEEVGDGKERLIQFDAFKQRGPGVDKVAYAYAAEASLSYHERLASVRVVDPAKFDEFERFQAVKNDEHIVSAIVGCIQEGVVKKMVLAKAAALRAHVPERAAIRAIEAYTGDDPAKHRWTYRLGERGAKVFALLMNPRDTSAPAAD